MMITGQFNEFELLTPYLSTVDSLNGNFSFLLLINGTFQKPIRSGQIVINGGKLNLINLVNPIKNINGVGILNNNQLIISNLTGKSLIENKKQNLFIKISDYIVDLIKNKEEIKENKDNIKIEGSIDLTNFFKPDYSILINSNN